MEAVSGHLIDEMLLRGKHSLVSMKWSAPENLFLN